MHQPLRHEALRRRVGVLVLLGALIAGIAGPGLRPVWADQTRGAGEPIRLVLPTLGVDAGVATFDMGPDGTVPVPQVGQLVAWYSYSALPGTAGNAVLAGHVDWQGRRGVFYDLKRVEVGDDLWLQDADGNWHRYLVVWSVSLPEDRTPLEETIGRTDVPSVTLITCSGSFDRTVGAYLERRFVRAELAPPDIP